MVGVGSQVEVTACRYFTLGTVLKNNLYISGKNDVLEKMEELSLFLITLIVDFGFQLLFGCLSIALKSEKFYDLIGGLTHIVCAIIGCAHRSSTLGNISFEAKLIQAICICLWAGKLGGFLLYRVIKTGRDRRFDDAKKNPAKLMVFWILQGFWVYINILPSLFMWETSKKSMTFVSVIGWVVYLFGLVFETVADYQKTAFRNIETNKGRFITSGLWSISRHPNYFGEIVLWYGLFIASCPYFSSQWAYFTFLCPTATALQICFISGIPFLEKRGMERWGNEAAYAQYVHTTGVLVPWLVCCECTPLPSRELLVDDEEIFPPNCEGKDGDGSDDLVDVDLTDPTNPPV